MRWCTQTEADRLEGEPINYSPLSIIQSRPGALCVCGRPHQHMKKKIHTRHPAQPSDLI